ncbi:MAG: TonB-dependent receptor [Acidobacteriota bacterium]
MKKRSCIRTTATCVLILAGCLPFPLAADSLTGKVTDPHGRVVPNAELTLFNKSNGQVRKATSSAAGAYSIEDLPAGTYLMEAQAGGAALSMSEDVTIAGSTTKDFTLSVSKSTVRVLVTATNSPLSEQEVAKVVDVVDAEDVNLRDEFSLTEAIRNVAGVRVFQLGGPGGFTTIRTRGMRNQDTALLVDGLRFRDAGSPQGDASAFFEDMNMIDTSRVEYLRGSGSSLYGSNAMAGVINVNSNQGGGKPRGSLRAEGGGLGMIRTTGNIGGGLKEDKFVYSGGFSYLNVLNGVRGNSPYRNTGAQGFAKYNLNSKMSLSGRLWGSNNTGLQQESPSFTPAILANFPATGTVKAIALPESQLKLFETKKPFAAGNSTFIPAVTDPDSHRDGSYLAGAAIFTHQLTSGTSYRVSYQGINTKRAYGDGPLGPGSFEPASPQKSHFDGRTDTLQARLDSRLGKYNLINAGYEFEREKYLNVESAGTPAPSDANIQIMQNNQSVFGQDQLQLMGGRLQVAVSGRIQTFDVRSLTIQGKTNPYTGVKVTSPENAYTGDVSVAYFFRESQTKLRGHAGNSYRAPAPYERLGTSYFSGFYGFYGDPRLKPEKAKAYDAGIDQWLWNSKVRLGATWFYTDLSETIIFDFANFPSATDPFGRFGGYRNTFGGGIARGIELSSQLSPTSKTNLQFNYTFTNSDQRTPTIGPNSFAIPGTSKHTFTAVATQWLTPRLNVTMDWFVASEYSLSPYGANSRRKIFKAPNKTDFVTNYKLPLTGRRSVEFYGKLENAFDVRYYEEGFASPGIWGIGGIKFNF